MTRNHSGVEPAERKRVSRKRFVLSHALRMNRRTFLHMSLVAALASVLPAFAQLGRKPRILLRNAWQSQNIGDIAHYLGMLELLQKFGIEADIFLWPGNLGNGADTLLAKTFPAVKVLKGPEAIKGAFKE